MTSQQKAIAKKLKENKVRNRYAAKGKIKQIDRRINHFNWLAQ